MAVAFDAVCVTDSFSFGAQTLTNASLTVGVGSNRVIVCPVIYNSTGTSVVQVIWDNGGTNQSLSLIGRRINTAGGGAAAELWGGVAPISGTKTMAVIMAASANDLCFGPLSFTGADQTGGVTTFKNFTAGTNTIGTPGVSITSAIGDFCVDAVAINAAVVSTNKTQNFIDNSANTTGAGSARTSGSASAPFLWSISAGGGITWVDIACDIAAAGAASITPQALFRFPILNGLGGGGSRSFNNPLGRMIDLLSVTSPLLSGR